MILIFFFNNLINDLKNYYTIIIILLNFSIVVNNLKNINFILSLFNIYTLC